MSEFRMRVTGRPWSRISLADTSGDRESQFLALFARELATVPELSRLPRDVSLYSVYPVPGGIAVYHPDIDDEPVFRVEVIAGESTGKRASARK
ncbi:hypothetical protein ABZ896_12550 [Streptomyces sp. NPDC047072]|uniref:hypothetical protein n=1 Tax=Streptomyces sp. NPDC047072 TaxID=3154809 RepID=UPI00340DD874